LQELRARLIVSRPRKVVHQLDAHLSSSVHYARDIGVLS